MALSESRITELYNKWKREPNTGWRDFARAIEVEVRASHGQAPAWATKPTEQQILEAAFAPAQPAAQQGAAYAALPDAPLSVFSKGPWVFKETGQDFSGAELDEAAFVAYREHASHGQVPAPAATGDDREGNDADH